MKNIREEFPVLTNNPDLIYFDNAATSLKPKMVIDAELNFLSKVSANSHAKDYKNGMIANELLTNVREKIQKLINAKSTNEIVLTSGTTLALNQVVFGIKNTIKQDDEIIITEIEHIANLLPWINLANQTGAKVIKCGLNKDYTVNIEKLKEIISSKTKVVSFAHVSNTIASTNNVKEIIKAIRSINKDVIVIVDVAQSISHLKIDVQDMDADFIAMSAHKLYGPFGIGFLYGKYDLLDKLEPILYGGGMISTIDDNLKDFKLSPLPTKLEAGTLNMSGIAGFEAAIDFINNIGIDKIHEYETMLKKNIRKQIKDKQLDKGIDFYNLENDAPVLLFNVKGIHPQDFASFMDRKYNIAMRSGKHCAIKATNSLNVNSTVRISFGIYNTIEEIDIFINALEHKDEIIKELFI